MKTSFSTHDRAIIRMAEHRAKFEHQCMMNWFMLAQTTSFENVRATRLALAVHAQHKSAMFSQEVRRLKGLEP